jgi:hypothetical protein
MSIDINVVEMDAQFVWGEAQGLLAGFGFTVRKTMDQEEITMGYTTSAEAAKAAVRRITEEVQGNGNFEVFDELFAKEFIDHTPAEHDSDMVVRQRYTYIRAAFDSRSAPRRRSQKRRRQDHCSFRLPRYCHQ